jgi:dienelactone hydrolase
VPTICRVTSPLHDAVARIPAATHEFLRIATADPVNVFEAMSTAGPAHRLDIDALLALPDADGPLPTVVIVPGSAGVSANHVTHSATLVSAGYAVCLLDPFGARAVESTVANQAQYSFAASAYDVAATLAHLAADPRIDATRISAQGHSRGGSAVLLAAMRPFADAVAGDAAFAGVYAVYPWCGQQFARPDVGSTVVRAIVGDQDDWVSVMAAQAQVQAITLTGGRASLRIVPGAHHSFDRDEPVHELPEARVSPHAPIEYLADDGSMIDPATGVADPARTDVDQFRAAVSAGFGQRGAHLGGSGDQPALFRADMLAFHASVLRP